MKVSKKSVDLDPAPLAIRAADFLRAHRFLEGGGGNIQIVVGAAVAATMESVSWFDGRRGGRGGDLLNDSDNHLTNITLELDLLAAVVTRVVEALADSSDHVGVAVVLLAGALAGGVEGDAAQSLRLEGSCDSEGGESDDDELGEHLEGDDSDCFL